MPTINGLTQRQVELLDTMWSLDSTADYDAWKETQDAREVETLEQLLFLAIAEEEGLVSLGDATSVIDRIMQT